MSNLTAVADLGHFALTCDSVATLFRRTVAVLARELDAAYVAVCRTDDGALSAVAAAGTSAAAGGGATVPISTGDLDPWGAVVAEPHEGRTFSEGKLELLRAVTAIVGQAVVRDQAEESLQIRLRQQSAIAELSRLTVNPVGTATINRACDLIIERVGVEHSLFFALDHETQMLCFRAGNRWFPDSLMMLPLTATSQGAECVARNEPVIVDDYASDTRFAATRSLLDWGVRSGVIVPVAGARGCLGILTAHTREPRTFSNEDIFFIEAVANLLAEALERDEARHDLALSENRQRDLIETASDVIFTTTAEGRILSLNPAFERVTGYKVDEWIGRSVFELNDPVEAQRIMTEAARTEPHTPYLTETTVVCPRGAVTLELSMIPRTAGGVAFAFHGFARDVTAARQAEAEKASLQAKLEQANRIAGLGKLAATVAHEFNNVLMGIAPFVDVMRRGKNIEVSLDHISRAVTRGRRITQDILRFTQPAEPARVDLDLGSWLQTMTMDAQTLVTDAYKVTFVPCVEKLNVRADAAQLQQVLTNLILNARDAMPGGGRVTIELRRELAGTKLRFALADPERYAHLVVRDTGYGMNEEMLRHAFEPLFTTKRNGTGLGLPVALQVVQRHGGELFVESTPGVGTTFHIFLPLTVPAAFPGLQEVPSEVNTSKAKLVVLVEDDPIVATGLIGLLAMEGMAVRLVKTGTEALQILSRIRPDLVILDVGLPDIDGTQVFTTLGSALRNVPVIFSTGHADRTKLEALLARPNVGFLLKPYKHAELLEVIWQVTSAVAA